MLNFVNIPVHISAIWLKSNLYLRYCIEDLITTHHWSGLTELCMNFVVAYCVMISTNQIAYFKRLLRSKGQSFQNTFRGIKDNVDGSI